MGVLNCGVCLFTTIRMILNDGDTDDGSRNEERDDDALIFISEWNWAKGDNRTSEPGAYQTRTD